MPSVMSDANYYELKTRYAGTTSPIYPSACPWCGLASSYSSCAFNVIPVFGTLACDKLRSLTNFVNDYQQR
jgi:hypothetical protein